MFEYDTTVAVVHRQL